MIYVTNTSPHALDVVACIVAGLAFMVALLAISVAVEARDRVMDQPTDVTTELGRCEADEARTDCRIEWDDGAPTVYWRATHEDM